ncbi:DNA-binding transcriptional regulator [soil metagenome]
MTGKGEPTSDGSVAAESEYHRVRGLERGLDVLVALNKMREGSSGDLAAATRLPRSTVHRLLETLRIAGFVTRSRLRDAYRLTARVHSLSDGHRTDDWISEIATPILQDLFGEIAWPVSVATYHDGAMVLRANTHRDSPLSLVRGLPGTRIPMMTSMGRAYLAWCPPTERYWLLRVLEEAQPASRDAAERRLLLERLLQETHDRGFAVRKRSGKERTSSIAVPIKAEDAMLGCLNVEWIDSALGLDVAIERFLGPLKTAAAKIVASYVERRRLPP